ncbi:MAG: hypothetical protein WD002_03925 [Pseudomonadales bacterium]
MTRIPLVETGDAPENVQKIYEQLQGKGSVLNVMNESPSFS